MNAKSFIIALLAICASSYINAQIGYQVSLLNSATGEPRANEMVSVTVEITNADGTSIIQQTQSATTNDFGVLSLAVGNSDSFANVDWSKQPFYVSATVDGIMIGKSQILNVPVAEAAKTLIPAISLDELCGTYKCTDEKWSERYTLTINNNWTWTYNEVDYTSEGDEDEYIESGTFSIRGDAIIFYIDTVFPDVSSPINSFYEIIFHNGLYYSDRGVSSYIIARTLNSKKQ